MIDEETQAQIEEALHRMKESKKGSAPICIEGFDGIMVYDNGHVSRRKTEMESN